MNFSINHPSILIYNTKIKINTKTYNFIEFLTIRLYLILLLQNFCSAFRIIGNLNRIRGTTLHCLYLTVQVNIGPLNHEFNSKTT